MRIFKYDGGRDEEVLDIFEKTLKASPYDIEFNRTYWAEWVKEVQYHPSLFSIFILEDEENRMVGVLVGQIYFGHPLLQFSKIAMEMFWYVEPKSRGKLSLQMVDAYEAWAKEVGATHICMSLLANEFKEKLDHMYRARGYVPLETQYIKPIIQ